MIRATLTLSALVMAGAAIAQTAPATTPSDPPQRVRNVMLAPGEKCPEASGPDEVVVCGNLEERYRIPKALRNTGPIPPQRQSWAAKQDVNDEVGREAAGLPNTCSPVGTGGQTGCTQLMLKRARDDARNARTGAPR